MLLSYVSGLLAFASAMTAAVVMVFAVYRLNTVVTKRVDEERLLLAGNRSVAIALGAVILSQSILLRHAVFPTMAVVRNVLVRPMTLGSAAWALGHGLLFFLILGSLSVASVLLATWLFTKMTRALPEREEILKDNVAVAIFFAFVVLGVTLIMNEGLADLSRSIIPYPESGIMQLQ